MLDAIATASSQHPHKTMLATVLAGNETVQLGTLTVPTYRFPESAVRALAHMASRSEWCIRLTPDLGGADRRDPARTGGPLPACLPGGWLDVPAAVAAGRSSRVAIGRDRCRLRTG